MTTKIQKFEDLQTAEMFLNGYLIGADVSKGVYGLTGLTLIVEGSTVTFTAPSGGKAYHDSGDLKTQIEGGAAGVKVLFHKGRLVLKEATLTSGVAITGGTGRALLGFAADANSTGRVFSLVGATGAATPFYAPPCIGPDNSIIVTTWE